MTWGPGAQVVPYLRVATEARALVAWVDDLHCRLARWTDGALVLHVLEELFQHLGHMEVTADAVARPACATRTRSPVIAAGATMALAQAPAAPMIEPDLSVVEPVLAWQVADAQALAKVIEGIGAHGLIPADYQLTDLRAAILAGPGAALDAQASKAFAWLAEDMRELADNLDVEDFAAGLGVVRDWFYGTMDDSFRHKTICAYDQVQARVWIFFASVYTLTF